MEKNRVADFLEDIAGLLETRDVLSTVAAGGPGDALRRRER